MQRSTSLAFLAGCLVLAYAAIGAAQPPGGDGERRGFSEGDREDFFRRMRERMEQRRSEEGGRDRGGEDRGERGFGSFGGRGFGSGFGDRGSGDRDRDEADRGFGRSGFGGFGGGGFGGFGGGGFGGGGFGSFGGPGFRGPGFGGPDFGGFGRGGGSSGDANDADERRSFGGGFGGGGWPGGAPFGGDRGSEERRSAPASPSASSRGPASETKKRPRVTLSLPAAYAVGDRDGDGQIGLHEWRRWKPEPGAVAEFRRLDLDGDGFLTPRELVKVTGGSGSASGGSSVQIATMQSGGAERSRERGRRGR